MSSIPLPGGGGLWHRKLETIVGERAESERGSEERFKAIVMLIFLLWFVSGFFSLFIYFLLTYHLHPLLTISFYRCIFNPVSWLRRLILTWPAFIIYYVVLTKINQSPRTTFLVHYYDCSSTICSEEMMKTELECM